MSRHLVCSALVVAALTLADLRASAEAGDAEAQFNLGGIYVTGVGVPQDAAEAVAWYRRAAQRHGTRGLDYRSQALVRPVTGERGPGSEAIRTAALASCRIHSRNARTSGRCRAAAVVMRQQRSGASA